MRSGGLYPRLLRGALLPALDVLNGTRVASVLGFLERSQWWDDADLVRLQQEKLGRMIEYTGQHSAFYRELWQTAGPERRAASRYPALDGLPVVTKDELRAHIGDFPLSSYRGRVIRVETSGSTGEPMTFFRSAEQDSWFWALRLRMWQWGGFVFGEPYVTLNLNPRTALKKRIQDVLFRCSYHGFNANSHDVDAVLADLARRRVPHLVGYASSLYLLSEAMERRGVTCDHVHSILSTGDTLFPHYRDAIERRFGARVVDYYGAGGEGFHLASQCEARGEYHVHVENSVVEILRDGKPAEPGEMGEVVVTQLDNHAMPLVRYATRDVARASLEDACACGRRLPLLAGVEGRVPDIVFAPDGSALVVHFFTILFEHLYGIRQFQIVQRMGEQITARIVPGDGFDRVAIERTVRDRVSAATHGSLAVEFEYVDAIPVSRSSKRRFVISEIVSQPLAVVSGTR